MHCNPSVYPRTARSAAYRRMGAGTATANVIKTLHMAPQRACCAQPDSRTPRAASARRSVLQPVQEQDVADEEQSDTDDRDLVSPEQCKCIL